MEEKLEMAMQQQKATHDAELATVRAQAAAQLIKSEAELASERGQVAATLAEGGRERKASHDAELAAMRKRIEQLTASLQTQKTELVQV